MSGRRPTVKLVPLIEDGRLQQLLILDGEALTLEKLLQQAPALSVQPIDASLLDRRLVDLDIRVLREDDRTPLYRPPGLLVAPCDGSEKTSEIESARPGQTKAAAVDAAPARTGTEKPEESGGENADAPPAASFPEHISDHEAVLQAYAREIDNAASFLRAGLSVLVYCDKLVVEDLWREMAARANLEPILLSVPDEDEGSLVPRGMRQRQLAELKALIRSLKEGHLLVIRHLDLLAGGNDANLPTESRELIELAYEASDRLVLAFADRSLDVPEVLAARFAVRLMISGVARTVIDRRGNELPLGHALVTSSEAARFQEYEPEALYKNVAGMNPIRIRDAIRYAVQESAGEGPVPIDKLHRAIRAFKAQTSANFEVPDVRFEDIGGYDDVKAELDRAMSLMLGAYNIGDESLRRELIPRGFIFYGPPGTGKTLFAKAVANRLNATIQVVSGPEVTDMYVGESERKVRDLFAEARRNAPAVLVFDEFDSIATQRSGRDDGGTRAGNALVAQILTEMDGFRPDVPMLVIGTTNRVDIIDPALLRPSRFKAVGIGLPDKQARRRIAEVHADHFEIDVSGQILEIIAAGTEGMNGDEIRSIFRDACVAKNCDGIDPDAHFLGRLVGKLRQASHSRQQEGAAPAAAPPTERRDRRPGPSGSMLRLTPDRAAEANANETPAKGES